MLRIEKQSVAEQWVGRYDPPAVFMNTLRQSRRDLVCGTKQRAVSALRAASDLIWWAGCW